MKFDTVIVYIEKECRMLIFFKNSAYKYIKLTKKSITHTTMHLTYLHIYTLLFMAVCARKQMRCDVNNRCYRRYLEEVVAVANCEFEVVNNTEMSRKFNWTKRILSY